MKFDQLDLSEDLLRGVAEAGFERCSPVQEQSLPESLAGKDIISQSQTGTGKTAVFLLSILNKLVAGGKEPGQPRALIMVPTRELAVQVDQEAKKLGKYLPFRSLAVYGGVGYQKQESELAKGVDIISATPGRMIDLYKSKTLSLHSIDQFVIDEADRMFDMGFIPDIRYIAGQLPKNRSVQTMLFSATLEKKVISLASQYMKPDPVLVEIDPEQITVDLIDQKLFYVSNEEKLSVLMGLLKKSEAQRVIIFANMKRTVELLDWKLNQNGFPAKMLTGDINQSQRQKIMDQMKSGKVRYLVATDVAARGLHIEDVSHVINYDLPKEAVYYVHRIGRTARAGKSGKAYSLACEDHVLNLPEIERFIERKIEKEWLDEEEMVPDLAGPFIRKKRPLEKKDAKRKSGKPIGKSSFQGRSEGTKVSGKIKREVVKKKSTLSGKRKPLSAKPEDRMAYYKKKYGEDFSSKKMDSLSSEKVSAKPGKENKDNKPSGGRSNVKKSGMLKKLFKVFGK